MVSQEEPITHPYFRIFALRRCPIKMDILNYLLEIYPEYTYPSDITKRTNHNESNVRANIGLEKIHNREKYKTTLIELDFVELKIIKDKKFIRFKDTDINRKLITKFNLER